MALSDSPKRAEKRSNIRRAVASKGRWWSDGQKLEAVQTFLVLGSVKLTAATLKIPEITVKVWRQSAWWKELEAELKLQDELQVSARLRKIAEKSYAEVEDRLEHGNWVYDQKTGGLRRIPAPLKDVHKVAMDSMEQRNNILNKEETSINEGEVAKKLDLLADRFAKLATQKIRNLEDGERTVDIEDVEIKDEDNAVHDQREEGLQERESGVQLETERTEEEKFEDSGTQAS